MLTERFLAKIFLPLCILLVAQYTLPARISPMQVAVAAGEVSPVEDAPQTRTSTNGDKVGLILSSLLILSLYSFPMSYAINWAFGDPKKAGKRPKKESSELKVISDSHTKPTQENGEGALAKRLPQWAQRAPQVTAGLAAGGCLMIVVVIVGAVAFALYYLFSSQPEKVSQILPQFAYWFPFALLGMVTDMPFQIIYWEDSRLRVLLRLIIWWFPRIIIVAFVINPPILQDLDPATTAVTVLAIDGVLAAFCLALYTAREQVAMGGVR